MQPKGKLIPVGGNLSLTETGTLKKILEQVKGTDSHIEIITTASEVPEEVGDIYSTACRSLGCHKVGVMHIRQREDVFTQEYLDRLKQADVLLFTGGDQMRLITIFGGSEFLDILYERYKKENFVIAGTSAGAMAMPGIMIYPSSDSDIFLKNEIKFFAGLNLIRNVIIDTHFMNRGRFWRLAQAVTSNPSCIGLGLSEDTGVVITEGNIIRSLGPGQVLVIDGHEIRHSNIADTQENTPLSIEHIIVHILSGHNTYHIKERKFHAG
jgi:cyanophycinase